MWYDVDSKKDVFLVGGLKQGGRNVLYLQLCLAFKFMKQEFQAKDANHSILKAIITVLINSEEGR